MSPRIIHLPLSGGDRKAQAKQIRRAQGLYAEYSRQALAIREEIAAKLREANRLECLAWNAVMFCGGPAAPSPSIRAALNGGFDLLEVQCNRCNRMDRIDLRGLKRPPLTPVHVLESVLFCRACTPDQLGAWRQRAHLVGLTRSEPPDPARPVRSGQKRG